VFSGLQPFAKVSNFLVMGGLNMAKSEGKIIGTFVGLIESLWKQVATHMSSSVAI
jgi:hypothetical protein